MIGVALRRLTENRRGGRAGIAIRSHSANSWIVGKPEVSGQRDDNDRF
jgi:hypothetical protein